jgi:hypothetical protein
MTTPHKATPKQWRDCEETAARWDDATAFHCLLELRDRLAAAEQRIQQLEDNHPAKPDSAASAIEPPELSNEEAFDLWLGPGEDELGIPATRRIHRAGWDAAMAAMANSQPTSNERQIRSSAPAGGLVERVMTAIERAQGDHEARAAIHAIADHMDAHGWGNSARWLRREVERG